MLSRSPFRPLVLLSDQLQYYGNSISGSNFTLARDGLPHTLFSSTDPLEVTKLEPVNNLARRNNIPIRIIDQAKACHALLEKRIL